MATQACKRRGDHGAQASLHTGALTCNMHTGTIAHNQCDRSAMIAIRRRRDCNQIWHDVRMARHTHARRARSTTTHTGGNSAPGSQITTTERLASCKNPLSNEMRRPLQDLPRQNCATHTTPAPYLRQSCILSLMPWVSKTCAMPLDCAARPPSRMCLLQRMPRSSQACAGAL